MLIALKAPNGGIVNVRDDAVNQMLAAGFRLVDETPPKKPTTRKRTTKAKE